MAGLRLLTLFLALAVWGGNSATSAERGASLFPNIVYILCDDLGYGDIGALNPEGKIRTPNVDRLAEGGMIFRNAHSSSAVCSPTRYGIMTGRYNWRSPLQHGVLGSLSPMLIEPGRLTVPKLLNSGYRISRSFQSGFHE